MAIVTGNQGIELSGRIGNVIYSRRYGKTVASALPDVSNVKRSPRQLKRQADFAHVMAMMQLVGEFTRIGFGRENPTRSTFHEAFSYNMPLFENAPEVEKEGLSWLQISDGWLAGTGQAAIDDITDREALIGWGDPVPGRKYNDMDQAMVVAVNDRQLSMTGMHDGIFRGMKQALLPMPSTAPGDTIWFFIAFFTEKQALGKYSLNGSSVSQFVGKWTD
ncbi:MAG: hypothetical protein CVU06_05455 [Bacteroidetes bacterium HGW-Bacteroidetes-22]|nr:MAG: hypothetical protein CVU06_05455 [Bacteroidetes bacterium HGW-Bacteroidetes-22]